MILLTGKKGLHFSNFSDFALASCKVYRKKVLKIAVFVYKAISGVAPNYISDLLIPYSPQRALRSSNQPLLTHVVAVKLKRVVGLSLL